MAATDVLLFAKDIPLGVADALHLQGACRPSPRHEGGGDGVHQGWNGAVPTALV